MFAHLISVYWDCWDYEDDHRPAGEYITRYARMGTYLSIRYGGFAPIHVF